MGERATAPMFPKPHHRFGDRGPGWPASAPTTEAVEALCVHFWQGDDFAHLETSEHVMSPDLYSKEDISVGPVTDNKSSACSFFFKVYASSNSNLILN